MQLLKYLFMFFRTTFELINIMYGSNTLNLDFKNTILFFVKDWYVFSQISVHLIQYFIGFHTIIYFSGNEELPSLCVKKGAKQVKWKKSNLFYVGRWIAKHLINKPTDVEMKAIDRLWKTIYTVNFEKYLVLIQYFIFVPYNCGLMMFCKFGTKQSLSKPIYLYLENEIP